MSDDYFTIAELRSLPDVSSTVKYPDAALVRARSWITAVIERVCETSFVYRTYTEVVDGSGAGSDGTLRLSRAWLRAVTDVTLDGGQVFSAGDLAALAVQKSGAIGRHRTGFDGYGADNDYDGRNLIPWPRGMQNISITYVAGYSATPPDDLKEAAMQAARWRVVNVDGHSGVSSRALSQQNADGIVRMAVANEDYPTGIPDCDSTINGWKRKTAIPGIA